MFPGPLFPAVSPYNVWSAFIQLGGGGQSGMGGNLNKCLHYFFAARFFLLPPAILQPFNTTECLVWPKICNFICDTNLPHSFPSLKFMPSVAQTYHLRTVSHYILLLGTSRAQRHILHFMLQSCRGKPIFTITFKLDRLLHKSAMTFETGSHFKCLGAH